MKTVELGQSVPQEGLREVRFANGRVLTAEDLRDQQEADRRRSRRLGSAIGAGVVRGLVVRRVSGAAKVVVGEGLAINERGQTLELGSEVELPLVKPSPDETPLQDGWFAECDPPNTTATDPVFAGVSAFVLVVGPAKEAQGGALHIASEEHGRAEVCGPRHEVQGVAFRLVGVNLSRASSDAGLTLDADSLDEQTPAGRSRLRNVIAHLCLGTPAAPRFFDDPFVPSNTYGVIDLLRKDCRLGPGEVPLALTYWTKQGLEFVDMWSVRRRPVIDVAGSPLQTLLRARRQAEVEAAMCQFHDHVKALLDGPGGSELETAEVRAYFRYLPPAGFLPLALGERRGFPPATAFEGVSVVGEHVVGNAHAEAVVRAGPGHGLLDLDRDATLALYLVRETLDEGSEAGLGAAPYVVFAAVDSGSDDGDGA